MTEDLASTAAMLGLKVSTRKTKRMRMNHFSDTPIILHGNVVEDHILRIYIYIRNSQAKQNK